MVIFASLALTQLIPLPWLPRYDWLLLICLAMQVWMVRFGLETRDELKVITCLPLDRPCARNVQSAYGLLVVSGGGLFEGVRRPALQRLYVRQCRELHVSGMAPAQAGVGELAIAFPVVTPIAAAIYLNFFTHHYWVIFVGG